MWFFLNSTTSHAPWLVQLFVSLILFAKVSCNPNLRHKDTLWNVEEHTNANIPQTESAPVPPVSFWSSLVEVSSFSWGRSQH